MLPFLSFALLVLGGGAFGDTQVFAILSNLCLQCELNFTEVLHCLLIS